MTQNSKKKRVRSRKRWLPFLAAGFFGLHMLAFLLLSQCRHQAPGVQLRGISYLHVQESYENDLTFELNKPPERMFYQYTSAPLAAKKEVVRLTEPQWDGYQALVALKTEDYTPIENYRLTLALQREERARPRLILLPQAVFRPPVLVGGVPMQPAKRVPEPSYFAFASLSVMGLLLRRRK